MYPLGQLLQFTCDAWSLNFPAWHGKHSVSSSPLSMNFAAGHDSLCQRKNGGKWEKVKWLCFFQFKKCALSLSYRTMISPYCCIFLWNIPSMRSFLEQVLFSKFKKLGSNGFVVREHSFQSSTRFCKNINLPIQSLSHLAHDGNIFTWPLT
jgi:hypothetical protein